MKYFIGFLFLLNIACFPSIKEQNEPKMNLGGTYIMAAITKECIVVCSDSRSVFYDQNKKISAYFEGTSKIFQYKNIALAMSGLYTYDTIEFRGLFKNFKAIHNEYIPVDKFFDTFIKYVKLKIKPTSFERFINNKFLVCGYLKSKPYIYWYHKKQSGTFFSIGDFKTNNESDNGFLSVREYLKNYTKTEAVAFSDRLIKEISKSRNKDSVSEVGGDASILYINNTGLTWVKSQNKYEFDTIRELLIANKKGLIKMWYRSKVDSLSLNRNY